MLAGTFKLKLKLSRLAQNWRPLESCRLKDSTIASAYKCSISNKFNVKYVLSTMGVSKESISKFLIGNRFHVKLRILSPENCKQSKPEGNDYLQKTHQNRTKTNEPQRPRSKQDTKANQRRTFNVLADSGRSDWKHFAEEVTQSVACTAEPIRHRPKKP